MSERIRHAPGSGATGFSDGFGDRQGHDPARAARFRRAHRPGDTVRGVFLRPAGQSSAFAASPASPAFGANSGGLGWADIEGQTLLASMPAFPQPGTQLLFLVERLEPDIVLRLLAAGDGAGTPPPSPARLAADYAAARDRLDARLAEALFPAWIPPGAPDRPVTAAARHGAFAAHVADNADTADLFLACQRARLALLPVLRMAHAGATLLHVPWLCPTARALDCAILPPRSEGEGLVRILLGGAPAALPGEDRAAAGPDGGASTALPCSPGRFLLHGLLRPSAPGAPARFAFRVMAERPAGSGGLDGLLEPLVDQLAQAMPATAASIDVALLSTGPLPPGPADPLGLLLATLHGGNGLLT